MLLMTSKSTWNCVDYHQPNPHLPPSKGRQTHHPILIHLEANEEGILLLPHAYVVTNTGSRTALTLLRTNTHKDGVQIQPNRLKLTNHTHSTSATVFRKLSKLRLVLVAMASSRGVESIKDCLPHAFLHLLLACPPNSQLLSQPTLDMNLPIASYGIVVLIPILEMTAHALGPIMMSQMVSYSEPEIPIFLLKDMEQSVFVQMGSMEKDIP